MDTRTNHPCDLCGSTDPIQILCANTEPVYVCGTCGFVYVPDRRSAEEVAESWNDIFGAGYSSAWPAVQARLAYVRAFFEEKHSFKDKFVLEIGAGEGAFLKMVKDRGGYPLAIEPSPDNCRKLTKAGIPAIQGTVERSSIGQHDIIAILWTLENCSDCIGMLRRAREMLLPEGRLIVATGSRVLVPFKKPLSSYFSDNAADTHCFRFSANTLRAALNIAGFEVERVNRYMDSDWLVMIARPGERVIPPVPYDNPGDVLRFFENWAGLWP